MKRRVLLVGTSIVIVAAMLGVAVAATTDFGVRRDELLRSSSGSLFGVKGALEASSTSTAPLAAANHDASKLVTFARSLKVRVVTQGQAGTNIDMMALWPNDVHPTHLIACNEEGTTEPGLQRINLRTGRAVTLLTGTTSCDPVEITPWHTIVFGEEAGGGASGGRVYELIRPLGVRGVTLDRATGVFAGGVGADHFAVRPALGRLSYEGVAVYPNGVVYYGDEKRPSNGTAGGSYYKFVPDELRDPGAGPIGSLGASPLATAGTIYGLKLGLRSGNTDFGQGTSYGLGSWVLLADPSVSDPDLGALAAAEKLTGYYRPEDIDVDPASLADGDVRFCGTNTGNESQDRLWGEMVCITDGTLQEAGVNAATPEATLFVAGNPELAMPDNLAYQPGHGNWIVHEDGDGPAVGRNNDLWDCLPDGADDDLMSDGCIRIATINDLVGAPGEGAAEWTGGLFDRSGTRFFVSVQHNETGFGVVLEVTGWR
jgi:Alkaline phosphatase PhoX